MDKIVGEEVLFSLNTGSVDKSATSTDIKKIHYIWIGGKLKSEYANELSSMAKLCKIKAIDLCLWTDNTSRNNNVLEFANLSSNGVTIKNTEDLVYELINNDKAFGLGYESREYILKAILFEYAVAPNYATIADIFRLMILFLEGGLYLDIDLKLRYTFELKNEDNFNEEYKFNLIRNVSVNSSESESVFSGGILDKLDTFYTLDNEHSKNEWIVDKFTNFLEKMGSGYPMGARDKCNDVIIAQPGNPKLAAILKCMAIIINAKKTNTDYLTFKKYKIDKDLFCSYVMELADTFWAINPMPNTLSRNNFDEFLIVRHDNNWLKSTCSVLHDGVADQYMLQNIKRLQENVFEQNLEFLAEYIKFSKYAVCDSASEFLSDMKNLVKCSKSIPRYIV